MFGYNLVVIVVGLFDNMVGLLLFLLILGGGMLVVFGLVLRGGC